VRGFLDGLRSKSDAASPEDGAIEFSLGGLFKIMCCTYPKVIDEKQQLMRIADSLEALNHRMNSIERSEKNKTFAEKKTHYSYFWLRNWFDRLSDFGLFPLDINYASVQYSPDII